MEPSREFSFRTRAIALEKLEEEFDLLVIGGGINGAGIAADAAKRKIRTLLLEKGDFACGTSSASSKLIHGGFRYLEQYKFRLVFESCKERFRLSKLYPHMILPIPFIFPVRKNFKHPLWFINLGFTLYDIIALFRNYKNHSWLSDIELQRLEEHLDLSQISAGFTLYDCRTNDARLTLLNIISAFNIGANTLNYCEVTGIKKHGEIFEVFFTDKENNRGYSVKTRSIVNAAGPYSEDVLKLIDLSYKPVVTLTKGIHLIFDREKVKNNNVLALVSPADSRPIFVAPWNKWTIIGTTDTFYPADGDKENIPFEKEEADYLLETANFYLPHAKLNKSDILSAYAGIRPLIHEEGLAPSKITREHKLIEQPSGFYTIIGGKLTTFRLMAKLVVDKISIYLRNKNFLKALLPCTTHIPEEAIAFSDSKISKEELFEKLFKNSPQLKSEIRENLYFSYGHRLTEVLCREPEKDNFFEQISATNPVIYGELLHAVKNEMCLTLEDFLMRRTMLYFFDPFLSSKTLEKLAGEMGKILGWTKGREKEEIDKYFLKLEKINKLKRS